MPIKDLNIQYSVMSSHSLRTSRRCTENGFRTAMDKLQMRLDEDILSLEKVYLEFTPAMMCNTLDPVLAFKCRLEKSHDELVQCRNADHSYVGSKDHIERCMLIQEKTFTMVTEIGKPISLFESKSSRGSKSYHISSTSFEVVEVESPAAFIILFFSPLVSGMSQSRSPQPTI